MLGMLLEILGRNPVIGELGIARQLVVFIDNLLRGATHLALGTRAVKHPVDDIANGPVPVALGPRAVLR